MEMTRHPNIVTGSSERVYDAVNFIVDGKVVSQYIVCPIKDGKDFPDGMVLEDCIQERTYYRTSEL